MDRPFVAENARELERLRSLVKRLSDDELRLPLGNDWTISVVLAHLAFWDQRSLVLMRKWKTSGVEPSPIDVDVTNDSLTPTWLALHPRVAANLAVSTAEAIDSELAKSSPDLISEIESMGDKFRLYRSIHRKLHLDQIEEALQNTR
ncbi:MAG: maleylpyruvate isomerase N-terminal domain-containing protein [Syntrophobacteraceae bacterium]